MNIFEIINTEEELEPETVRQLLPDLSEEDFNWLMAARTVKQTTSFLEDMHIFENVMRAFNKLPVDFNNVQGIAPKMVWYGCDLIERLWKGVKLNYSWEVKKYMQYVFNNDGVFGIYPFNKDENDEAYKIAEDLLNPNLQIDVDPLNPAHIAGQKLAEMLIYTQRMKSNEYSQ